MNDFKQKTIDAYNIFADYYAQDNAISLWSEEAELFHQQLLGNNIIEIGCGAGRDAVFLLQKNIAYTGIDGSEKMLALAKKNVPKANFVLMDFYHIQFPEKSFDGFWAAASLLHIPKKELPAILTSIHTITKKNGIGFISVKEKNTMEEGIIKQTKGSQPIERYFSFYSNEEFQKILTQRNYAILFQGNKTERDGTTWMWYIIKCIS